MSRQRLQRSSRGPSTSHRVSKRARASRTLRRSMRSSAPRARRAERASRKRARVVSRVQTTRGTEGLMSTADEIARLAEPVNGRFGEYGGQYVAETLMPAIGELEVAWRAARTDASFWSEVDALLADYVG